MQSRTILLMSVAPMRDALSPLTFVTLMLLELLTHFDNKSLLPTHEERRVLISCSSSLCRFPLLFALFSASKGNKLGPIEKFAPVSLFPLMLEICWYYLRVYELVLEYCCWYTTN